MCTEIEDRPRERRVGDVWVGVCVCACLVPQSPGEASPCKPLEIPGNVIQCLILKNHSAGNPPGQQ